MNRWLASGIVLALILLVLAAWPRETPWAFLGEHTLDGVFR